MIEARCLFMRGHTLASVDKYMARFSLILSKTLKLDIHLASVNVEEIEEIYCLDENQNKVEVDGKMPIHIDGTGFISDDLVSCCPNNVTKGTAKKKKKKTQRYLLFIRFWDDSLTAASVVFNAIC